MSTQRSIPESAIDEYAKDHDYENWLFTDLVDLCKRRGLKCTRTKDDLIERLVKDDTKFLKRFDDYLKKYGANFNERNVDKWMNRITLCNLSTPQLKEQCIYRDICVSGDKSTLCYNIKKYDEDTIERMKRFVRNYMS